MGSFQDKILLSTSAGFFASGDQGKTWAPAPVAEPKMLNANFIRVEGDFFAHTPEGLFCRYDTSAGKWNILSRLPAFTPGFSGSSAFHYSGGKLYSASHGLLMSADLGRTWTKISSQGLSGTEKFVSITRSPLGKVFAISVEGSAAVGFLSTDDGASWSTGTLLEQSPWGWRVDQSMEFSPDGSSILVATRTCVLRISSSHSPPLILDSLMPGDSSRDPIFLVIGNRLLVGYASGGLHLYGDADTGTVFQTVGTGLGTWGIAQLAKGSSYVFARTEEGIFRSADTGRTWMKTPGPDNSTFLVAEGDHVYAGVEKNIYHSSNQGSSWTRNASSRNLSLEGSRLILADMRLFHLGAESSLEISTDGGKTWNPVGRKFDGPVHSMDVRGNEIYVGLDGGIRISRDGGRNWGNPASGLPDQWVSSIATIGPDIFLGGDVLYRSSDQGKTWKNIGLFAGTSFPSISLTTRGDTLIRGGSGLGVVFSTDRGETWSPLPGTADLNACTFLSIPGGLLIGAQDGKVMRFSFAENKGTLMDAGTFSENMQLMEVRGRYFIGSRRGVSLSEDGAESWKVSNQGLSLYDVTALAVSDGKLIVGTPYDGYVQGVTYGEEWKKNLGPAGEPSFSVNSIATEGDWVAIGGRSNSVHLFKNGVRVEPFPPTPGTGEISNLVLTKGTLYASTASGLFTISLAASAIPSQWTKASLETKSLSVLAVHGRKVVTGDYSNRPLRISTDSGNNWNPTPGLTGFVPVAAFRDSSALVVGTTYGIFVSEDDGKTFRTESLRNLRRYSMVAHKGKVYVGTQDGVYATDGRNDFGFLKNEVLQSRPAYALVFHEDTLFVGSRGEILKVPLTEIPTSSASISGKVELGPLHLAWDRSGRGNAIRYQVSSPSLLTLTLVDPLGRKQVLFSGKLHLPGNYLHATEVRAHGALAYILKATPAGAGFKKEVLRTGWLAP
ncbi:MAG: hypothetical protein ABIW76_23000 [Fibrobacteria bacterium]